MKSSFAYFKNKIKKTVILVVVMYVSVAFSGCIYEFDFDNDAGDFSYRNEIVTSQNDIFSEESSQSITTEVPQLPAISDKGDKNVSFTWEYNDEEWTYSLDIPYESYDYYKQMDRASLVNSYSYFVTDTYDDEWVGGIADTFFEEGQNYGYTDYDIICLMITFVQSLEYVSDIIGTGYDEYPKFPLETLYDEGGDCEDSSILLSSLIRETGYGTVMVMFDDHMGVGIQGAEDMEGYYFEDNGIRYYYVETTTSGWGIGEMPEELIDKEAELLYLD